MRDYDWRILLLNKLCPVRWTPLVGMCIMIVHFESTLNEGKWHIVFPCIYNVVNERIMTHGRRDFQERQFLLPLFFLFYGECMTLYIPCSILLVPNTVFHSHHFATCAFVRLSCSCKLQCDSHISSCFAVLTTTTTSAI